MLIALAFSATGAVRAQDQARDWPRFHVGVAAGHSQSGADTSGAWPPEVDWAKPTPDNGTGRKAFAGFRPVRVVGVEIQYIDFGTGSDVTYGESFGSGQGTLRDNSSITASAEATVLAALLFIPQPSPSLDIYGKVGAANLDESFTVSADDYESSNPPFYGLSSSFHDEVEQSDSAPFVGFGARFHVTRAVGVSLEYEAVLGDSGDPTTLVSVGFAGQF